MLISFIISNRIKFLFLMYIKRILGSFFKKYKMLYITDIQTKRILITYLITK